MTRTSYSDPLSWPGLDDAWMDALLLSDGGQMMMVRTEGRWRDGRHADRAMGPPKTSSVVWTGMSSVFMVGVVDFNGDHCNVLVGRDRRDGNVTWECYMGMLHGNVTCEGRPVPRRSQRTIQRRKRLAIGNFNDRTSAGLSLTQKFGDDSGTSSSANFDYKDNNSTKTNLHSSDPWVSNHNKHAVRYRVVWAVSWVAVASRNVSGAVSRACRTDCGPR
jgi:hypothetical protein